MLAVPSRHRSLTLLATMLAMQLLLLAVQIKREQQVRLIRVWAVEIVAPLGRAGVWMTDGVGGAWNGYIALRHLRQENQQLHSEIDQFKLRDAALESRAVEGDRLAGLLAFRQAHADVPTLAGRIIGASPDASSRILFLDRGSRDGVARDMGVITPDGVVGKILAVFPDTSQILLLTDKDSGVGALLEGTRTQGPVRGNGEPTLRMEYVSNEMPVSAGLTVLTSGQDRIFPKDLPVGTVVKAAANAHGAFQDISVKPAAHLDQLEEVLVLLTRQPLLPSRDLGTSSAGSTTPRPAAPAPTTPAPTPAALSSGTPR